MLAAPLKLTFKTQSHVRSFLCYLSGFFIDQTLAEARKGFKAICDNSVSCKSASQNVVLVRGFNTDLQGCLDDRVLLNAISKKEPERSVNNLPISSAWNESA